MTALAAPGDTWGISGPVFIIGYIGLAVVVLIVSLVVRRSIANATPAGSADGVDNRPHDVAYLNGGADLAVLSALSSMRVAGTIVAAGKRNVQAAGRIDPRAEPLEVAIHSSALVPIARTSLRWQRPVQAALEETAARLTEAGLLLSPDQRSRIRQVGIAMLAVAVLGLIRLLAGLSEAKPIGFLVVALIVVAFVSLQLLLKAPTRSGPGDRTLRDLRTAHQSLAPRMNPNWATYGPTGAALGVGVFGAAALWAADPAFASDLNAQRSMGGSDSSGGIFSSGDSGSSGGDSGGGGGGCGGGGGGCGG